MDKAEYVDEIQLIQDQNNIEFEIYPLVSEIIAPTLEGLAKRYVFARRISPLGQIYYGISSFPDIAILDRNFNNKEHGAITLENWKRLKGCVEAKAYKKTLYGLAELKNQIKKAGDKLGRNPAQLIGEILWYKKVLYTNGLQWKFFSLTYLEDEEDQIIKIAKERVEKSIGGNQFPWWKSDLILKIIDRDRISEEIITEDCIKNWDEFLEKIKLINWNA